MWLKKGETTSVMLCPSSVSKEEPICAKSDHCLCREFHHLELPGLKDHSGFEYQATDGDLVRPQVQNI